jgi:hypothetical protein
MDLNGGTIDGVVIGGTTAAAGTFSTLNATGGGALTGTWTDLGTVTTVDLNGGTIDGTIVGGASAAAGTFTTLRATSLGVGGVAANYAVTAYGASFGIVQVVNAATGSAAGDGSYIGVLNDTNLRVWNLEAAAIQFGTNSAERARITSGGNFLLGTTSGSNLLTVAGTASISGALTASGGGALTGTWSDLGTVTTIDINGGTIDGVVIGSSAAAAATVTTLTAGGAAVYPGVITAIGAAGEVIAGNTTGSLATFSNAGAAAISLHGAAANSATVYFGTTGASGNTIGRLVYDFSANAMAFFTGNTERARIDSSGNVGIGTSSPAYPLDIRAVNPIAGRLLNLRNTTGAGNGSLILHDLTSVGYWEAGIPSGGNAYVVKGNGTEFVRVDSSGSLLIGTTTAGASKLVVADDSIQINTAKTPASAAATGTTGEFAWDASYFYICTATNTWRRVAHATW